MTAWTEVRPAHICANSVLLARLYLFPLPHTHTPSSSLTHTRTARPPACRRERMQDGTIMGCRHKRYPHIQGVQFHPESIMTQSGMRIVRNFVEMYCQ